MDPGHLLHSALTCPSSANARCLTHLYPTHSNSSFHRNTTTHIRRSGWIANRMWNGGIILPDSALSSPKPAPTLLKRPFQEQCGSGLIAPSGRFRSCLYKWGMASSAACECGAEQTVDDDNRMAGQHLTRDLVRPSSGQ